MKTYELKISGESEDMKYISSVKRLEDNEEFSVYEDKVYIAGKPFLIGQIIEVEDKYWKGRPFILLQAANRMALVHLECAEKVKPQDEDNQ